MEGCMGPRVGLDAVEKRKLFYLCPESNPDSSLCRLSPKCITIRDVVLKIKMPLLSCMHFLIEINGH
jgi:hypothetical protein